MALKVNFDNAYSYHYRTSKVTAFMLEVTFPNSAEKYTYISYDFLARVMMTRTAKSEGGVTVVPFNQLDRESLETFRERLIDLGGTPPELPADPNCVPTLAKERRNTF